jgi:hypothetical protein
LTSYAVFVGDANGSMFGFFVCYCGEMEDGEKLLRPLRSLGKPLSDSIRPMTYLEIQGLLGAYFPADPPLSFYVKSGFLTELSGGAIDAIVDRAANAPGTLCSASLHLIARRSQLEARCDVGTMRLAIGGGEIF